MRHSEDGQRMLDNIRKLRERFEPEALKKMKRLRRAKTA